MARLRVVTAAILCTLGLLGSPAFAGKADNTLRIAVTDWWSTLDPYQFPLDEAAIFFRYTYEPLISYDERAHKFVPRLAKSWTQVDDKTIEFDLRDDVKFSNGDKFDADDVVGTINWLIDPATTLRFKALYTWVDKVEKLGPYKVRITAKTPFATELETIAYRFYILDSKVLAKLDDKAAYGRTAPVTTGPYKIVSLDQQKMVAVQNDNYYDKNGPYGGHMKTVIAMPIPDRQTQIAQLMTGNIDVIRNANADTARQMAQVPDARITSTHAGLLMYLTLDSTGRSDNKVMMDQRVRKAVMEAIDRKELAKTVIPGNGAADILDGICVSADIGCASTTKPPAYDPADAKKLLAEAGYPNGFDLEFDVHEPIKEIGEAIAGMLQKVGIRASMRTLPLTLYVRLRGDGKLTAFLGFYPTGSMPDMDNIFDFFFDANRDYWNDPIIKAAQQAGATDTDIEKRTADYARGVDEVNKMNDILPVADLPLVFVHSKDVKIVPDPLSPINTDVNDFAWTN